MDPGPPHPRLRLSCFCSVKLAASALGPEASPGGATGCGLLVIVDQVVRGCDVFPVCFTCRHLGCRCATTGEMPLGFVFLFGGR